ncbi:MAG: aminotransferase class I/II-fold pyridoxal phosphate-dependent enzyme, partial [Propionibacterium sp.]|nr:aminotransferase class I/II-fold pyridoxal phosphate-dependent enzyme [Propionibacterium sp.]
GAFVAEMDFGLAEPIKRALHRSIDLGQSGYLAPGWNAELQRATSEFVARRYGWEVEPANVLAAPDVLTGMVLTMKHHMAAEGRVVVPTPAYMPFMMLPQAHGHELVQVPMQRTSTSWELDFHAIDEVLREGDLFVLCNPHNPIGKVYTRDEMLTLSEIVERRGARVFNDEIHAPLVFPGSQHVPYPMVSEAAARHSLTSMSASKAWNLPGYKCAQLILNDEDLAGADAFMFELHGTATPGVFANIAAYEESEDWLAETIEYLAENQRLLHELLAEELPEVRCIPNEGTYLAWLDCTELGLDVAPGEFFLEHAGVATTDGGACGDAGTGSVRLNFATPRPLLKRMVRQMGEAVGRHRAQA